MLVEVSFVIWIIVPICFMVTTLGMAIISK